MAAEQAVELQTDVSLVTCQRIISSTGSRELGTISPLHIIANFDKSVIGGFLEQ